MNAEIKELYLQQSAEIAKRIKQGKELTEFRKGQIFMRYGFAYRILRVNKKSLTVYRIGMRKNCNNDPKWCARKERIDKIFIDPYGSNCYEMSVYEAAFLLNVTRLLSHKDK